MQDGPAMVQPQLPVSGDKVHFLTWLHGRHLSQRNLYGFPYVEKDRPSSDSILKHSIYRFVIFQDDTSLYPLYASALLRCHRFLYEQPE
jgi:hypothetical protein